MQAVDLDTGDVKTILRGVQGCDGLRVTPWGTLVATEEFAGTNGGLYEILWDPSSTEQYSITERGDDGAAEGLENRMRDGELQGDYGFTDFALTNRWKNLFVDRTEAVAKISDDEISAYVAHDNYAPLRERMQKNEARGQSGPDAHRDVPGSRPCRTKCTAPTPDGSATKGTAQYSILRVPSLKPAANRSTRVAPNAKSAHATIGRRLGARADPAQTQTKAPAPVIKAPR